MLLDNKILLINKLQISLTFDDGVTKSVMVNVGDVIGVNYKADGGERYIKGKAKEISCNFNSSIGRIESAIFIKIDGSEEYAGNVVYVKPNSIMNIVTFSSEETVLNPVISVDNNEQRVLMVRENELGIFQYSKNGLTWKGAGQGAQGLSAYEIAVKLGYEGTEEEWLKSLKGKSAYEIAVDNGFVGTEVEWLDSLKALSVDVIQQRADIDYTAILLNIPLTV